MTDKEIVDFLLLQINSFPQHSLNARDVEIGPDLRWTQRRNAPLTRDALAALCVSARNQLAARMKRKLTK